MKSVTIASNVPLLSSGMQSAENVNHAHKAISTTPNSTDVTAKSHVQPQDKLTQLQDNASVSLTKKATQCFGTPRKVHATAQQNTPSGTVNTVSFVQLELNSIQRNINVITAQKDLLETTKATNVFQDFEIDPFIQLIV